MDPSHLCAHSPSTDGTGRWHGLAAHLQGTAQLASRFLSGIESEAWGRTVGLLHDFGKAHPEWQEWLRACAKDPTARRRGPGHKLLGALQASRFSAPAGELLALLIAGHHGGLLDLSEFSGSLNDPQLEARLRTTEVEYPLPVPAYLPAFPSWILRCKDREERKLRLDLFVRMVFSALVDADFLDTEAHFAGHPRPRAFPSLAEYLPALDRHLDALPQAGAVNGLRRDVLQACRSAAGSPTGSFTLTVPTGGGKTFSSLRFALEHALANQQERVVYALPFTTIIEQSAQRFREAFLGLGPEVLVEHHSNLDPGSESDASRLAAENWDAPLILTTQVQLFESLFGRAPSRCRKVHALQNAVLILDEVQSLPRIFLASILHALNDLVNHYHTTVVLMTATQPDLGLRSTASGRFPGFDPPPREIVPESLAPRLWQGLRRVQTRWPASWAAPDPATPAPSFWQRLAESVLEYPQALAITHLKGDARALFQAVQALDSAALHLSAAMCPAHRRTVLETVRHRLAAGAPCRFVTTQVVEAGVDLDFPVVFRAMAGLESLAQSAGRCNREGRLPKPGRFFVYEAPTRPPGSLREHLDVARSLLELHPDLDLFHPHLFPTYFHWLHDPARLDGAGIQSDRGSFKFQTVAEKFHMIPDATCPVFVPFGDQALGLLQRLRQEGPSQPLLRALQPFTVAVYPQAFAELQVQGALDEVAEGFQALLQAPGPNYHPATGFTAQADATCLQMA